MPIRDEEILAAAQALADSLAQQRLLLLVDRLRLQEVARTVVKDVAWTMVVVVVSTMKLT